MNEDLEGLFLFENSISQMFDSEHRIAMAVLERVRQMKKEHNNGKNDE